MFGNAPGVVHTIDATLPKQAVLAAGIELLAGGGGAPYGPAQAAAATTQVTPAAKM
eukprot:COSAG01_NODE_94_length_26962_cov_9.110933_15_plen_56_part_00